MPLKIIGAGYGRTGTMSLYTALNQLGFPCYHMIEVIQNKANASHLDFWRKVANDREGAPQDWESVFARYTAAVDNPACCVWRELAAAYPDAKIVLTLHPKGADAWYESTIDTIYFTENRWQFKVLEIATPFGRKFADMSRKLIWGRAHRGTMNDRSRAIAEYNRHIEEVKAALPPERLLVFSVDQGWEPLCRFLNVAVPAGAFPNVNDREQIKQTIAGMTRGAYAILAGAGVIAAAAIYGVWRLLG
jgi:hypothetical protein